MIVVETDNTSKAGPGSNGMVCISLVGEFGCSEEIYLSQSLTCRDTFCKGQTDAFFIRLHASLGEIFFIYVAYLTPKFFLPRYVFGFKSISRVSCTILAVHTVYPPGHLDSQSIGYSLNSRHNYS